MFVRCWPLLKRLLLIHYEPDSDERTFQQRAETQSSNNVDVTVAIPDARESERLFGVPLARRGLQPVFLRVVNHSTVPLRLHFRSIDPHYYPPLEAAARCHFSIIKRLSAFGAFAWFFFPLLAPLIPFKLISAQRANEKMDEWFQSLGFHRRPIAPGKTGEGFVFTALDVGTKQVRVRLIAADAIARAEIMALSDQSNRESDRSMIEPVVDLSFTIQVPGINADYLHRHPAHQFATDQLPDYDLPSLLTQLKAVSPVTSNHRGSGKGDPVNLVIIGDFEVLLTAFSARWDETEVISLATCWKTAQAFLLGSEYRYSPVSSLYLFGRNQDIALQQIRQSISARIHLRLWQAKMTFQRHPVWVGQVSRDIGVRFTTAAWNLTTHRIDPDVDESRDYVLEDLMDAERVDMAGYATMQPPSTADTPQRNLTGDPYYSDGRRVIILLSEHRMAPRFIAWEEGGGRL